MKKTLLMLCFMLPMFLMAQNRPDKQRNDKKHFAPVSFVYMTMEMNQINKPVESPKRNKNKKSKEISKSKTNYTFESLNKNLVNSLSKQSADFKTEMDALNLLGRMGWELVHIKGNKFYFKSSKKK